MLTNMSDWFLGHRNQSWRWWSGDCICPWLSMWVHVHLSELPEETVQVLLCAKLHSGRGRPPLHRWVAQYVIRLPHLFTVIASHERFAWFMSVCHNFLKVWNYPKSRLSSFGYKLDIVCSDQKQTFNSSPSPGNLGFIWLSPPFPYLECFMQVAWN